MALVYLRFLINNQAENGCIINTNNIKTISELQSVSNSGFEVCLMSGLAFNFNQIYYKGKFMYVHTMEQLYSLLTKLESGDIQDGSS